MTETDPFDLALAFTLKWEGGEGHSQDLAGAVNRGISQDTYDTYRQGKGLSPKSVSQITDAEVVIVYRSLFWDRCHAEFMCLPLAIAHFDTAVNFSVRGSIEFLQETLGLTIDGDFGSATEAALQKQNNLTTAKRYCENRMAYRHHRVKQTPSQEIFLEGWLRRDRDLWEYISQQENFQPKNINLNSSIEQTGKSMKLEDFVGTEKKYDVKAIAADIELTEQIQGRLIDLGLMAPPVDGIFGPVSSASLKRFQELMNCGEPNFLGAKTAQYLLEATPDSISGDAPTLYTTRNTVFKARPIQSTQLSDAEKESVDGANLSS
jgi:lysozyme family protein